MRKKKVLPIVYKVGYYDENHILTFKTFPEDKGDEARKFHAKLKQALIYKEVKE